jgi:hypothetical protein
MRAPRRPRAAAALVAAAAALAVAGPGAGAARADKAGSATASLGAVQATLTWNAAQFGVSAPRLVIVRDGATVLDSSPVAASQSCKPAGGDGCVYFASGARKSPLQVADLDGDGEPEVLVDVFTGGAHCCALTEIMRLVGTTYSIREASWGNVGYDLRDLGSDGIPEIVTADDAFSAAFSSFASSVLPPRVIAYRGGQLLVATRLFPGVVRAGLRSARRTLRRLVRRRFETLGAVAAVTADLYLLRRGREVRPFLRGLRRRHRLISFAGPAPRSFERTLLAFLHRRGYR